MFAKYGVSLLLSVDYYFLMFFEIFGRCFSLMPIILRGHARVVPGRSKWIGEKAFCPAVLFTSKIVEEEER